MNFLKWFKKEDRDEPEMKIGDPVYLSWVGYESGKSHRVQAINLKKGLFRLELDKEYKIKDFTWDGIRWLNLSIIKIEKEIKLDEEKQMKEGWRFR